MGFLSEITAQQRERYARSPDLGQLREAAAAASAVRGFEAALTEAAAREGVALIAEVKRASPSAGPINDGADPVRQADAYARAGSAAISVLTEPEHFHGSIDDLRAVRGAVSLPVLRKDFIVHEAQLLEARAAGADSVLLITASLQDDELVALLASSRELGMEPLVETHSDEDVERALVTDARIVGVNARDLETLVVDRGAARRRLALIGDERCSVAESGIGGRADVLAAMQAGASAILVGETLMRSGDPAATVAELLGRTEGDR